MAKEGRFPTYFRSILNFFVGLVVLGVFAGSWILRPEGRGHLGQDLDLEGPLPDTVLVVMQVVISLALLGSTLFVILSKRYGPKDKHWAYGTIGLVVGFWLKH